MDKDTCTHQQDGSMPAVFVSHGSPMTALEPREAGRFFQHLGRALTAGFGKPRAVLAVSAHGLAGEPVLLAAHRHGALHDFGGFDPRLRSLRYDAPGAPQLATQALALLHAAGLPAHSADQGGLDHGVWTPLRHAFPDASVPVLPLAWPAGWSPAQLFALGQALAPLAADRVLVLASGSITHNLRRVFTAAGMAAVDAPASPESTAFRDWFAQKTAAGDWPALLDYRRQAPHAVLMHPTEEHLLPFFVAAGAGAGAGPGARAGASAGAGIGADAVPDAPVTRADAVGARPAPRASATGLRVHASLTYGDLGMDAYAFGGSPSARRSLMA